MHCISQVEGRITHACTFCSKKKQVCVPVAAWTKPIIDPMYSNGESLAQVNFTVLMSV